MDPQIIAVAITALVGVAGILSTHLLARSQRKGEIDRQNSERGDRYRFATYEARAALYSDFLAELRALVISADLRVTVARSFRRNLELGLVDAARLGATSSTDPKLSEQLLEFAGALENDPTLSARMARRGLEDGLPPALDTMSTVRRVTELAARIAIIGGQDAVKAARSAEREAVASSLRLQALELSDFDDSLDLEPLKAAISQVEEAAIYELRLLPFGDRVPLDELRAKAQESENGEP